MNAKKDKKTEVKRSVMSDMRWIGTLFIHFEVAIHEMAPETTVGVKNMVSRDNFAELETTRMQTGQS